MSTSRISRRDSNRSRGRHEHGEEQRRYERRADQSFREVWPETLRADRYYFILGERTIKVRSIVIGGFVGAVMGVVFAGLGGGLVRAQKYPALGLLPAMLRKSSRKAKRNNKL